MTEETGNGEVDPRPLSRQDWRFLYSSSVCCGRAGQCNHWQHEQRGPQQVRGM